MYSKMKLINIKIIIYFISIIFLAVLINIKLSGNTDKSSEIKTLPLVNISADKCNLQQNGCVINTAEFELRVVLEKTIYYLRPFSIHAEGKAKDNASVENIYMNFKMNGMNMGVNRFLLKKESLSDNIQRWRGNALLPVCVSGRADWLVELEIVTKQTRYILSVPVTVQQPVN